MAQSAAPAAAAAAAAEAGISSSCEVEEPERLVGIITGILSKQAANHRVDF